MKNPPDPVPFLVLGIMSFASFALSFYILSGMEHWGRYYLQLATGAIITMIVGFVLIAIPVVTEIIKRPNEVEVGNNIVLRWRLAGVEVKPLDSISDLYVDSKGDGSIDSRWTGGSVGFRGQRIRCGLTYEIAKGIQREYFEKFGTYPPIPSRARGK